MFPPSYIAQIEKMTKRVRTWSRENPGKAPVFNWKWPRHVMVAADVYAAIRYGLVHLNDDARQLVDVMCGGFKDAPTVFMVRVALEVAKLPEETAC